MEDDDTKLCTNCKREISTSNFVMHEMHCRRHIMLCKDCDEPIPRSEMDQHFNDVHAKVPCELCKAEIAKEKMEDHMENACSKKPVRCEYCELSKPRDSFEAHNDYCGSRTECCVLCQQYIMLKDMTLHESSGCTYPEPKPSAAPNQSVPSHDPFSMSYLHEFLDSDFRQMPNPIPDFTSNLRRELQRGKDRTARDRNASNRSRPTLPISRGRRSSQNKSNVNAQRERDSNDTLPSNADSNWIPPDMDYDTMLALQMAHEDMAANQGIVPSTEWVNNRENDDLTYDWQHFSDDDVNIDREAQTTLHPEQSDMAIPCEFCGLEIPFDLYIEHTDYCHQEEGPNNTSMTPSMDRNNTVPATFGGQRSTIPVINNLRPSQTSGSTYESPAVGGGEEDYGEEFSLPCEFCEEMYPSEIILQHQVLCPANGMATPRAATPATGLGVKGKNRDQQEVAGSDISLLQMSDLDIEDNDSESGPMSNFFRDESYKKSLQSSSIKYGAAGPSRFDESSIRPANRSSRRHSNDVEDDGPSRPNSKTTQRTRATLNQLLQDGGEVDEQAIASSSRERGGYPGNFANNHPRRAARPGNDKTSRGTRNDRGSVNSRTVLRQLEGGAGPAGALGPRQRKTGSRPSQQALSSHTSQATQPARSRVNASTSNNSSSSSSQSRQRSDLLFSPELRPKPNDNNRRL